MVTQHKKDMLQFTFICALGPSHWPRRPFGPKNECLDKVSFFGGGRLTDLQSPEKYDHISSFNIVACGSFLKYISNVQDRASSNHEDNRKHMDHDSLSHF